MVSEHTEPKKNRKILLLIILLFVIVVVVLFAGRSFFIPSETSAPQELVKDSPVPGEASQAFIKDLKFITTDLTFPQKTDLKLRTSNLQFRVEAVE